MRTGTNLLAGLSLPLLLALALPGASADPIAKVELPDGPPSTGLQYAACVHTAGDCSDGGGYFLLSVEDGPLSVCVQDHVPSQTLC